MLKNSTKTRTRLKQLLIVEFFWLYISIRKLQEIPIMTDKEYIENFNAETATVEDQIKFINILLNMPDEE